jgi:hypothetical protein
MAPEESEHIMDGGRELARPGGLSNRKRSIRAHGVSTEGNETAEAEEERRRALDGVIGPLALRVETQMSAALLEGSVQAPSLQTVREDRFCRLSLVRRKEGFGGTRARWVTCEHPAKRERIRARAVPQRGAGADLPGTLSLCIPVQGERLPDGSRVLEDLFQSGQALADDTRATTHVSGAFWRWFLQDRIQATGRDEGHVVSLRMPSHVQHGGRRLAHPRDLTVGKPPSDQADHRRRPHRDGRVSRAHVLADVGRGRQHAQTRSRPALRGSRAR